MSRLRLFKDKMEVPLDLKTLKKMEKKELFKEQKKQEDSKHNVFYIKGNFQEYYQEMEILGEGCVGLVKKVSRVSDNKVFASKMVKTKDEEEVVLNVISEFKNQRQLKHPNIVEVYELYVDETKGRIYTIMELVEAKEMFDVISKLGQYSESVAVHIFKQILAAIDYLHERMVCHRDLKPNNILCNEDGTCVKITDFNVSKFAHYDNAHKKASTEEGRKQVLMWTYTGTVAFSAPEIFNGDSYDESVDMWSAGVVLYTMLAGYQPFEAEYVQDLVAKIQSCDYSFPSDPFKQISENAKDLIKKCLQIDPQYRIKPTEALTHTWIQDKQNNQPLYEASNKISLNLTKLISKFSVYRNLGLIRKTIKRKQTFCPSMLYKMKNSPPPPSSLGISFLNDYDDIQSSTSVFQQAFLNQNSEKLAHHFGTASHYHSNISSTQIDQTSGYDEQPYQTRPSFAAFQSQQTTQRGSQKYINNGFNILEPLSSLANSFSDIQSIQNLDDESYSASPVKSLILLPRRSDGNESSQFGMRRTRKQAQTNIIYNRYKLNESDQLIVQAIEDDQLSNNNYSQTTQDLSESDQILCQKIYSKLNHVPFPNKLNKMRVNSLCNIQTTQYPPRDHHQKFSEIDEIRKNLNNNNNHCNGNTKNREKTSQETASSKSKFASISNFNLLNIEQTPISYQSLSDSQIKTSANIKIRENVEFEENTSEDTIQSNSRQTQQDTSLEILFDGLQQRLIQSS